MHHYTHHTCTADMSGGARLHNLWADLVPREAIRHSFLMHGILALASLHLASTKTSAPERVRYLRLCDKHQAAALAESRDIMADIPDDVSSALFAFSSLTCLSSLARSVLRANTMPDPKYVSVDEIVEVLVLTRGVREVVAVSVDPIARGPLSPLLYGYEVEDTIRINLPDNIRALFALMQQMLADRCDDKERHTLCSNAVIYLQDVVRNLFYFLQKDTQSVGHIWRWTAMVRIRKLCRKATANSLSQIDMGFIRLVQNLYQPALVIMTFFVVTCLLVRHCWYMQDWGEYAFVGLESVISDDFKHYLAWPREQVATGAAGLTNCDVKIETVDPPDGESRTNSVYQRLYNAEPPQVS